MSVNLPTLWPTAPRSCRMHATIPLKCVFTQPTTPTTFSAMHATVCVKRPAIYHMCMRIHRCNLRQYMCIPLPLRLALVVPRWNAARPVVTSPMATATPAAAAAAPSLNHQRPPTMPARRAGRRGRSVRFRGVRRRSRPTIPRSFHLKSTKQQRPSTIIGDHSPQCGPNTHTLAHHSHRQTYAATHASTHTHGLMDTCSTGSGAGPGECGRRTAELTAFGETTIIHSFSNVGGERADQPR